MIRSFVKQYRSWEPVAQLALAIALGLLLLALVVAAWGPAELRPVALFGAFALLVAAQGVVMWSNRGMVTVYTQAQRLYLEENFAGACTLLEELRSAGKADARALTLLGNAYRQRAMLDESEAAIREALAINEEFYFSLYGFGRTLLVQGRYDEAAAAIEKALARGGPAIIQLDLGEACYRSGDYEAAAAWIEKGLAHATDAYRRLMGQYLLFRMTQAAAPNPELLAEGMPYWAAQAERYRDTDYGQALLDDMLAMQAIAEEE